MTRPLLLRPVELTKSWGVEQWLNATRPEATAGVYGQQRTLAELLESEPRLLGEWARALFGDELPIFTKILRTNFPPLVHAGFRRVVDRAQFLSWLDEEQDGLRELFVHVESGERTAFDAFAHDYTAWATTQGEARWQGDDDNALGQSLRPTLRRLRFNRERIVDVLHEVDLRKEVGHLLLTGAGMVHAIFGLSHQFHAKDHSRGALETLLVDLRALAANGASDEQLRARVASVDLEALRKANLAEPKNEGWLPICIDNELLLVEPQQSSDTTFSIADFYTPFVWNGTRARFRKGAPESGLSTRQLDAELAGVDFSVTNLDEVRRTPRQIRSSDGVVLSELVDDPASWPFFTAHQLELERGAKFLGSPARGTFQQIVVLDGALAIEGGTIDRNRPAFIPSGASYSLTASARSIVLLLSVPGPYRAFT